MPTAANCERIDSDVLKTEQDSSLSTASSMTSYTVCVKKTTRSSTFMFFCRVGDADIKYELKMNR